MGMVRVYDLATAFRLTTKEVLERLSGAGIEAASFGSAVDEVRAREVLSQPVARIPAHTIRPGPGTTPAKPAPKRTARPKAKAVAGEAPTAEKPAPKPRKPLKVAEEGEEKPASKPRAPRKRAPAAEAKPLLITLEAPTVELTAAAPTVEAPPVPEIAPPLAPPPPVAVEEVAAPAPAVTAAPPPPVVEPAAPAPQPETPAPPAPAPPPTGAPPREAPAAPRRPMPRHPAPPWPEATRRPAPPAPERPRARQEPPRPVVEPPRPVVAAGRAPEPEVAALVEPKAAPRAPAPPAPPPAKPAPPAPKILKVGEALTPKGLAERMSATTSDVIKRLIKLGVLTTINTPIDLETIGKVAQQFGYTVEKASPEEMVAEIGEAEDPKLLRPRAPVVTVMGHVDHGKTSLLDAIRHTNVIATEAGGITQHIGAYEVEVPGHAVDRVVFLDTPGHEAFTAMRARGAQATDIVVLVVAADDGVMPQTVEAINHAKDAKVPILVAINKIDKADADPNRIKQQLTEYGLVAEEWGGETIFAPVSAKRREGIENLLDNLLVLAEVQELKANPDKPARGLVVEAELDKGRGPVSTVLVQSGTLRVGDVLVAGFHHGRVRAMVNDKGRKIGLAGPSTPVKILGLSGVPLAGDTFAAVGDERKARQIALARTEKHRQETMASQPRITLDALHQQIQQGAVKELRMILKGDVQGSVEPLRDSLERLGTDQVKVRVIHSSVGAITESDIMLASASNAIIVGFNVRPEPKAQRLAEQERVDLRLYTVIYDAINEIRAAMEGLLEPQYVERPLGRVEVRQAFNISKVGTIAGSFVVDGKVTRDASVRLVRDGRVVFTGKIASLRRFKDDVREVQSGLECGVGLVNYNDIHQGDVLEAFDVQEIAPKL